MRATIRRRLRTSRASRVVRATVVIYSGTTYNEGTETMSAGEMAKVIGKLADLRMGEFVVLVKIMDVRNRYGNLDYKVTPVRGSGVAWKSADSVSNIRGAKRVISSHSPDRE